MDTALEMETHFTFADYITWPDEQRWEIIDGIAYAMSSPSDRHQSILLALASQFYTFLRGKKCKAYIAPFDVRLNADGADDTVVQPDILVVCDKSKVEDGKSVVGAPDLVIEITSPSTATYDKVKKFNLYQQAGVREYWIVDPDNKEIFAYTRHEVGFIARAYEGHESAPVDILDGFEINLPEIFEGL